MAAVVKVVMALTNWWPEATDALQQIAPPPEGQHEIQFRWLVAPTDYWYLFVGLWKTGEPFVLVEHDIVVRRDTINDLASCPHPWCAYVYHEAPGDPVSGLGCTKFEPDGPLNNDSAWVPGWANVDSTVRGLMEARGWQVHEHHPWLRHLNPRVAAQQNEGR